MNKIAIAGVILAAGLIMVAVAIRFFGTQQDFAPAPAGPHTGDAAAAAAHPGYVYGRVVTLDGATMEGRLRWGGDQEAFWGDYFNGAKKRNPWAAQVPPERLPKERDDIRIFGVTIVNRERPVGLGRLLMTRFGDIARIEAAVDEVRVTLKSGTTFGLDRFEANDLDDGVRVWDRAKGVVDLDSMRVRAIDLLPGTGTGDAAERLHGTVRTRQGDFKGFVQWDRNDCVGTDELDGYAKDRPVRLRFDSIRSIARRSNDAALVTLRDGREIELSGTRETGPGNRGLYVDDARYGRVLVSWAAFERIDFSPGGSGPGYGDFPPGAPLRGSVVTRGGRRVSGRLVYDLDESETTETLDAPARGVHYTIPFGLIASVALHGSAEQRARVTLHSGEELLLERSGDLGEKNGGLLISVDSRERPEYVPWAEVEQILLERPAAMYPPLKRAEDTLKDGARGNGLVARREGSGGAAQEMASGVHGISASTISNAPFPPNRTSAVRSKPSPARGASRRLKARSTP